MTQGAGHQRPFSRAASPERIQNGLQHLALISTFVADRPGPPAATATGVLWATSRGSAGATRTRAASVVRPSHPLQPGAIVRLELQPFESRSGLHPTR